MKLVDVLYDDDGTVALARIESENPLTIRCLLATKKLYEGSIVYAYEKETLFIDDSVISGYYEPTDTEETLGYSKIPGQRDKFIRMNDSDDEEYVPSEDGDGDDSEDETVINSDDEDEDESDSE
jgi:hypothetical protein